MKTNDFVVKYELNINDKFNHGDFTKDLAHEFLIKLELTQPLNIKSFNDSVTAIRARWEAINLKTNGQLPEKLWGFFYSTVICKIKDQLFPEIKLFKDDKKSYEEAKTQRESSLKHFDFEWKFLLSKIGKMKLTVSELDTLGVSEIISVDQVLEAYSNLLNQYQSNNNLKLVDYEKLVGAKNRSLHYLYTK